MEEPLGTPNAKRKAPQQQGFQGYFQRRSCSTKDGRQSSSSGKLCLGRLLGQGNFDVVPEFSDKETETERVKGDWLEAPLSSFLDWR